MSLPLLDYLDNLDILVYLNYSVIHPSRLVSVATRSHRP